MGKNVGSNPRQRSRRPRHASSSLWHPRDFGSHPQHARDRRAGGVLRGGLDF